MASAAGGITERTFGRLPDGRAVELYTLTNRHGVQVEISNLGATLVELRAPDRHGQVADILLGHDNAAAYWADTKTYFGALVGRYANRIANGRFRLDGREYSLPINDPPNSLHGGTEGFNRRLWTARTESTRAGPALELALVSADGDQGYPGRLEVRVIYTLTNANELRIEFFATTDRDTVVNLTSHGYWNLGGEGSGSVAGTELRINARRYTPVNAALIPTGAIEAVKDTPLDFTRMRAIGEHHYDDNFVLEGGAAAVEAYDPASGRELKMYTTQPGVQLYTADGLDQVRGKHGHVYGPHSGFALEAQHFPDSPNHANFPSTELRPGQLYHEVTVYDFSDR